MESPLRQTTKHNIFNKIKNKATSLISKIQDVKDNVEIKEEIKNIAENVQENREIDRVAENYAANTNVNKDDLIRMANYGIFNHETDTIINVPNKGHYTHQSVANNERRKNQGERVNQFLGGKDDVGGKQIYTPIGGTGKNLVFDKEKYLNYIEK